MKGATPVLMKVEFTLLLVWLIPWFHKGSVKDWQATTFNARAETVTTSHAYQGAFAKRRCRVIADG